jgi:predicted Holliday junction resolvase-like endonuclease
MKDYLLKILNSESVIQIFLFVLIFLSGFLIGFLIVSLKNFDKIRKLRKDAINRSRAVLTGQISEQIAPYLPNFPCNPEDVKFLGRPVDFIGFVTSKADENLPLEERRIKEIVFIEVKSGKSVLTKREKEVKNAIESGRVKYIEYRI